MRRSRAGYTLILIGLSSPSVVAIVWGRSLPPGGRSMTNIELLAARWGLPLCAVTALIGVLVAWPKGPLRRSLFRIWCLICSTVLASALLIFWALFFA